MKKIVVAVSIGAMLIIFAFAMFFPLLSAPLILQGEADEVKISSCVPGRVEQIYVQEGATVKKGELLITLDAPELRARAVQASAARRAAFARQKKTESCSRPEEIDALFSLWQKAVVVERIANQTNERIQGFYEDGVVSAQQRDEVQARCDAAKKDVDAAKAKFAMAVEGARMEDKQSAVALTEQAGGVVQEVESYLFFMGGSGDT